MKKALFTIGIALLFAACGNNQESTTEDTTNTTPVEEIAEEPSFAFEMTDKAVGPIELGMKIKDVPQSVDGLYDNIKKEKTLIDFGTSEIKMTCTLNGVETMQISGYDHNNKVASIRVNKGANVKMTIADGEEYAYISDDSLVPEFPDI